MSSSRYDISPEKYRKMKRQARVMRTEVWKANRQDMLYRGWSQFVLPIIGGMLFIVAVCLFMRIFGG